MDKPLSIHPRYLDVRGTAVYLSISVYSIYRLVERRAIPFTPLFPSGTRKKPTLRFDTVELNRWMAKQNIRTITELIDVKDVKV